MYLKPRLVATACATSSPPAPTWREIETTRVFMANSATLVLGRDCSANVEMGSQFVGFSCRNEEGPRSIGGLLAEAGGSARELTLETAGDALEAIEQVTVEARASESLHHVERVRGAHCAAVGALAGER